MCAEHDLRTMERTASAGYNGLVGAGLSCVNAKNRRLTNMVSGHLQVKKGYYYAVLSYYDSKNKRHVKYISTGLPEKGNKRKAEAELVKIRNAFEPPAEIGELCSNMLFADYLLGWLEIVKVRVKPTTLRLL